MPQQRTLPHTRFSAIVRSRDPWQPNGLERYLCLFRWRGPSDVEIDEIYVPRFEQETGNQLRTCSCSHKERPGACIPTVVCVGTIHATYAIGGGLLPCAQGCSLPSGYAEQSNRAPHWHQAKASTSRCDFPHPRFLVWTRRQGTRGRCGEGEARQVFTPRHLKYLHGAEN